MAVEFLGKGNDDGTVFGTKTDSKLGFYGETTPVVKATITLSAGTTTTLLKADVLTILSTLDAMGLITKG
jgi:hypothetical protein